MCGPLKKVPELGYGDTSTGNMLIQGDNLEALKSLLPFYAGQVKCIYIDPPYNTKQAVSELYDDNLEHSQWLEFMWPRLELLRDFLTEDGYLAVQIDDREFARLYIIMCEIFGESRLKTIVVKMSEASGLKMGSVKRSGRIPKLKEFIILAKMDGIRDLSLNPVPKDKWDTEYNIFLENFTRSDKDLIDAIGEKDDISDEDIANLDGIASRLNLSSVAIETRRLGLTGKAKETWQFENAYRICQCATSSSVKNLAEIKKLTCNQDVFFVRNKNCDIAYMVRATYSEQSRKPRLQLIFAEDNLTQHPGDLWLDIKTTGLDAEGKVEFKNGKKPEQLIYRILNMATKKNDIIMDVFAGSGTTGAVAQKMGCRWIMVEKGSQSESHIVPRLKRICENNDPVGATGITNWQGGGGFRYYRLGNPVFDELGQIQPDIRFNTLAAHIWFSEMNQPMAAGDVSSPFLGAQGSNGLALLYNGILRDRSVNGGNVLTRQTLKIIWDAAGDFDGVLTVYGERTVLAEASLKVENIIFKQTPYDVRARK